LGVSDASAADELAEDLEDFLFFAMAKFLDEELGLRP
jgi:hypothetical protein